jgi:L-2-hydroxyglutarate oxidase
VPQARALVRNLIYPVPDPELPFLGVHFTRRVDGTVEAGPNAVLAWKREGYGRASFSLRDTLATLAFPGFWRMAPRHAAIAWSEYRRAWSRKRFVASLRELVPEMGEHDVRRAGCGVRAQAVDRLGRLLDDFAFAEGDRQLHVLNAPSPGATASLAIGREIAGRLLAEVSASRSA